MTMAENSPNGYKKSMWEKEKLLVTSNFSSFQCFEKTCTADMLKQGLVWERVKTHPCRKTEQMLLRLDSV